MKSQRNMARLGLMLFAVFTFVVSLYTTFPAQVVTMRVAQEVAKATGGAVRIKVGQAELWRLSGVLAHDVRLEVGRGAPLQIDAAKIRLRLLPLLLLRASVYAQAQLGQGFAELVLALDKSHAAEIKLDAVDLGKQLFFARELGVPMQGLVSGEATLTGVPRWPLVRGNVEVTLDKWSVGPATVEGVALPQIGLGQVTMALDVQDGQAKLTSFRQHGGGNMSIDVRGKVLLAEPIDTSILDVCGRVRVDPSFLQANPKLAAAVQLAEVQLKRDTTGFLNIPLGGMMRAPQLKPGLCPVR